MFASRPPSSPHTQKGKPVTMNAVRRTYRVAKLAVFGLTVAAGGLVVLVMLFLAVFANRGGGGQ